MDKWEQSLTDKLAEEQKNKEDIKKQRLELLESLKNDTDNKYYNIIDTIFQLLEKQTEQMTLFIDKELEKVKHLKENTRGKEQNSTQTVK